MMGDNLDLGGSMEERTSRPQVPPGRFERIVEMANEGIWTLDAAGRTDYINERGAAILGYSPEEMLGRPPTDFAPLELRAVWNMVDGRPGAGVVRGVELPMQHKNGRMVWVSASMQPLFDSYGNDDGALATFSDITERKKVEDELSMSEFHLARAQQMAHLGSWEWDIPLDRQFWSDEVYRIMGMQPREIKPKYKDFLDFVHPSERARVESAITSALDHSIYDVEYRYLTRAGKEGYAHSQGAVTFDDKGKPVKMDGTIQDVTNRRMAEEALKDSERRLGLALSAGKLATWDWRFTSREVVWNDELYRLMGYDAEEVKPGLQAFLDRVHPEDRADVEAAVRSAAEDQNDYNLEFRALWPSGTLRWIEARGRTERDEPGRLSRSYGVMIDVTDRKMVEQELRRSNNELQEFAYIASHDLQEPLRMITSFLSLLDQRYGERLDPQARSYVDLAVDGAQRMKQLIEDLLTYSRVETRGKEFSPVDMNKVAQLVLSELKLSIIEAEAKVQVDPLPTVMADRTQMSQLISNMISNAIKFRSSEPPRITLSARPQGGEWTFEVKDNGIGIDPRYHEYVFKMFHRLHTREEYPGTGIGLAIARKIVERHGGRMGVESEPGKGSTFFFTLPRS
ncbi:MAG: PAS domain-containing protein [Methanomassiliicoccus sp.]|nr:PAS domain-containing protein [Methanomassiliicoccus sp.]